MPESNSQQPVYKPRNDAEWLAGFFISNSSFNTLRNLEELAKIILGWASVTLEVFVRRDFGERYFNLVRVMIGAVFIQVTLAFSNFWGDTSVAFGIRPPAEEITVNRWFVLSYMGLSAVHLARIWWRNNIAHIPWHSYSRGDSWLGFLIPLTGGRMSDWFLYRIVEPLICASVAWFLFPVDSFTRGWLVFASFALFVHNNMIYSAQRNRWLDLMDSQIVSRYFNEERQHQERLRQGVSETNGFQVVGVPRMVRETTPDIAATVRETLAYQSGQLSEFAANGDDEPQPAAQEEGQGEA